MRVAPPPLWRRWAPFGLFLVAPVVGVVVDQLVPGPRGHWSGHLGSATAAAIGPSLEGFDSGHALAETGDMLVVLGGLAFAAALGAFRRVGLGVAVAGALLSCFLPWVLPAVGTVLLLAFLLRGPRPWATREDPVTMRGR